MKIVLFYFEMAIKITGSAQNYRVGRVSGNTTIFFFRPEEVFRCADSSVKIYDYDNIVQSSFIKSIAWITYGVLIGAKLIAWLFNKI